LKLKTDVRRGPVIARPPGVEGVGAASRGAANSSRETMENCPHCGHQISAENMTEKVSLGKRSVGRASAEEVLLEIRRQLRYPGLPSEFVQYINRWIDRTGL
jgi:hypothetical protein